MADAILIELLSDTTFSRGDGTAGEVDVEIVHDELGLPSLPGRTLRGLLRDSWLAMRDAFPRELDGAAREVLGEARTLERRGAVECVVQDGQVDEATRRWIAWAVNRQDAPVASHDVLRALTSVRRQTARDPRTGAPREGSLRAIRVLSREVVLEAPLRVNGFTDAHWCVLARACLGVRHAGLGRSRGSGHVRLRVVREGRDRTRELARLEDLP